VLASTIYSINNLGGFKMTYFISPANGYRYKLIPVLLTILLIVFTGTLYSQSTVIKLPTRDSSSSVIVRDSNNTVVLRINADGGFYVSGGSTSNVVPVSGAGSRLMWSRKKYAFRAGYVSGAQWNEANIGDYSVAGGQSTTASGWNSTAFGGMTTASANWSTAMGSSTTASGDYSTATGNNTTASGNGSTAMGSYTTASGLNSVAMGYNSTAQGNTCIGIGDNAVADGGHSISIGYNTTSSGDYAMALGNYVSILSNNGGSCIIGDNSTTSTTNTSASNQMTMRFAGGYRLFTNSVCTTGVTLAAGGSSWATVSDSTLKTNFERADGECFLSNLSKLKLGSWNYKGQEPRQFRHYGPMAQEIFHYFGKDEYGTIGDPTTLASADMDGIMMICLQALEKRTAELQKANEQIAVHENKIRSMEEKIERLTQLLNSPITNK
jgi:hypothetical protein